MIKITDKKDCCGCAACVQRCPKHCISMKEDEEGFLYPLVDEASCINCGLCEKTCPIISRPERLPVIEVFAVKNRNEAERMASSSGGVFIALAKKVIEQGGVVFGAVFDGNWEVKHTYAESMDGVHPMMGSKYVQSRIGDTFRLAERFLKEGRKVLFMGTPCQIAGLHKYLKRDNVNLLTVDLICHGVPSPQIWRRYLDEMFGNDAAFKAAGGKNTVLHSSLNAMSLIKDIKFRDKTDGWEKYRFVVHGASASKADKNSVLLSDIYSDNLYMKGYLNDLYLRESCYHCPSRDFTSRSDLTIGDFWGVGQLGMSDMNDHKGLSIVTVNTEKGMRMFDLMSASLVYRELTLEQAVASNSNLKYSNTKNEKLVQKFNGYKNIMPLSAAVNKTLHTNPAKRLIIKILYKLGLRK